MASSARIDELLKKFEENPRRYFAPLANEYRKAGDAQRAIELCREHLPQQPGHMSGHIVYGQALFEAGDFDEARRVFEAALALDPENLIALRHLGDIARDHGDVTAARDWYQRVLDADPRNEEIATQIASLSTMTAQPDAHAVAPLDADIHADVAAGLAEPPAPVPELLDDILAPAPPAAVAAPNSAADAAAAAERDLDLDFDAMESGPPRGSVNSERPLGLEPTAAGGEAALEDLPTAEFAIGPTKPAPRAADDTNFGEIDLDAAPPTDRASALELDEALDTGLAPTPPSGEAAFADEAPEPQRAAARSEESTRVDDLDLGELEAPVEAATGGGADSPRGTAVPAAEPASEGYSLGRLAGLESMEFTAPSDSAAAEVTDPTLGHQLREDAVPAAATTPAEFVTETMAELYLQQGFRDEALAVYKQLLSQSPNDANLRDRVAQLESGSSSTLSAAAVSNSVIEAAQQRQSARPARTVRTFFASLASRRAPAARGGGAVAEPSAAEGEWASGAEESAADAYVEATGEGYDSPAAEAAAPDSNVGRPPAAFDEFGFPAVDERPSADEGNQDAAAENAVEDAESAASAELPESAAIEPATLDYLAHDGSQGGAAESDDAALAESPSAPTGPVDTLFDGAAVSTHDEEAATTLADAFGPAPTPRAPTGEANTVRGASRASTPAANGSASPDASKRDARTPATRPAARELSLDDVFRDTPRRSGNVRREPGAGFSFDQFFAEGSTGGKGGGGPRTDAASSGASASGASAETPGDAGDPTTVDIEQFNAWLEGLKKK